MRAPDAAEALPLPDAPHRGGADPHRLGHRHRGPMGRLMRRLLVGDRRNRRQTAASCFPLWRGRDRKWSTHAISRSPRALGKRTGERWSRCLSALHDRRARSLLLACPCRKAASGALRGAISSTSACPKHLPALSAKFRSSGVARLSFSIATLCSTTTTVRRLTCANSPGRRCRGGSQIAQRYHLD